MKGFAARVLALAAVLSLLLSLLPATALAEPPTPEGTPQVTSSGDANLDKLSPDLRTAVSEGSGAPLRVMVFAEPGTNFDGLLDHPLAGKADFDGLKTTSGLTTDAKLLKLASLDGVKAVVGTGGAVVPPPPGEPTPRPKLDRKARPAPAARPPAAPAPSGNQLSLWNAIDIMKSKQANALGYNGNGVIVSVNDTGVDFGHPDLQGTQARDPNPASPYYGWPLAADDNSIFTYLVTGSADGTWYSDTSSTFTYPSGSATGAVDIFNGVLTHTVVFSNTSRSGVYHYGWSPDFSLGYTEGDPSVDVSPMVLVVDEATAGVYNTVYVDLGDGDILTYNFTQANPSRKGSEAVWADLTGDGIADVSGGMIYWIADGMNMVPGADALYNTAGIPPAGAGDLVTFFGDYNGQSHGTGVASQVVAQSVIDSQFGQAANVPEFAGVISGTQVIGGVLHGMAPSAKLFAGGWGNYNNWLLAAVGYDGVPGTTDDAQIITVSWGNLNITPGWDFYSRFATFLERRVNPTTTILSASGNGGYGYGVMDTNGVSSSILTVGASTQYGSDDVPSTISQTSQITFDDITYFSNRGPNGIGQVKPQVLCIGNSATGAAPLNLAVSPITHFYDGQTAWEEFGGTSQATPMCAGILADVMTAFRGRTGRWPTYLEAKALLMNGADNINYDSLSQGAGRANALRSSLLAAGQDGASVSPSEWNAGAYRGTSYEAFANIMFPGALSTQTFTVTNMSGASPLTATLSSKYLVKTSEVVTTFLTMPVSTESAYNFRKPDYLWRLDPMIPAGTDLMEINVYSPYGEYSLGDPSVPSTQKLRGDNAWYSRVYDWSDLNSNGIVWTDGNSNGVVDPGELDEPGIDPISGEPRLDTSSEFNQLNEGNNSANTLQLRVQKPLERMTTGLYFGLVHRVRSPLVPQTHLQIKYTFYHFVDWPWLTTSTPQVVVPAGATRTFSSTLALPADAKLGLYQGSILVHDTSGGPAVDTVLPVVVNVAANSASFSYSSPGGSDQIFDNGRMFGGYDWRGNGWYPQGDWRLFYTDVPNDAPVLPNSSFLVQASWVYTPTDIDIWAFGPSPHFADIPITTSIVGPYNLAQTGASPQTVHSTGTGNAYTFKTSSGVAQELITAKMQTGLNEFLFHNVLYNGPASGEPYSITVGTAAVNPASVTMTTTQSHLDVPMTFVASLDLPNGLQALGYGMSAPMFYNDQYVATGGDNFYTFTVNTAGLLTVKTVAAGSASNYDIDLYLERLVGTSWVQVAQSGGSTATESVQVTQPQNGTYRVDINGYNVPGPASKYNLSIDLRQGTGVTLSGVPSGFIAAGTVITMNVGIDVPGVGVRNGLVYLGPSGSPTAFSIPLTVIKTGMKIFLPVIQQNYPAP